MPGSRTLCMFASLLHEPLEFNSICSHFTGRPVQKREYEHAVQAVEQSMQTILCRSGLKKLAPAPDSPSEKKAKPAPSLHELEYVEALDKIRQENSKTIPERQIMKSKPLK